MPALQTLEVEVSPVGENQADDPKVIVDGNLNTDYHVLSLEDSVGNVPSKLVLRYLKDFDTSSPSTLNKSFPDWRAGKKIAVFANEGILRFVGSLMMRQDQGQGDSVIWTALDDRLLLQWIYIRGALVRDPIDQNVKIVRRYTAQMNPAGNWNCTGYTFPGDFPVTALQNETLPVFTDIADYGKTYQSPDEAFFADLPENGAPTAWTPRRALQYIWLLSQIGEYQDTDGELARDVPGIDRRWTSLRSSKRLIWEQKQIAGMVGVDPAGVVDPLDRKMPDTNLRGLSMLNAITRVLEVAGTHGLRVSPFIQNLGADGTGEAGAWWYYWDKLLGDEIEAGTKRFMTRIEFYPKGLQLVDTKGRFGQAIPLQRGGIADINDANTAFDFQVSADWSNTRVAALVEGADISVESELEYDSGVTETLVPAWNSVEEDNYISMVVGSATDIDIYARYPAKQPGTTGVVSTWLTADGLDGRLFARAKSTEAFALAQGAFPFVFRAFTIDSADSDLDAAFNGVGGIYNDRDLYPVLKTKRQIRNNQAQFFLKDPLGNGEIENWIRARYPVRVQTRSSDETNYKDVSYTTGIKVTSDGYIWLDQYGIAADGSPQCIYDGAIRGPKPHDVSLKAIKLNAWFPMDHRTQGYATGRGLLPPFDASLLEDLGGLPYVYVDSPNAYNEIHQINSSPAAILQFTETNANGDPVIANIPLNRYLPLGRSKSMRSTRHSAR